MNDEIKHEILAAFKNVKEVLDKGDPLADEVPGSGHRISAGSDPEREDWERSDEEEFDKLRHSLISEVNKINKILR